MGTRELPRHLRVDASDAGRQLRLFGLAGRTYAPYEQWEDYRAGMFGGVISESAVESCRLLLRTDELCRAAMVRVIQDWPIATAVNLTNSGANRRAWLGQAACCLSTGATCSSTKRAWWQLTDAQRAAANAIADEVIALWHNQQ